MKAGWTVTKLTRVFAQQNRALVGLRVAFTWNKNVRLVGKVSHATYDVIRVETLYGPMFLADDDTFDLLDPGPSPAFNLKLPLLGICLFWARGVVHEEK